MLSLELEGVAAEEPRLDLFLIAEAPQHRDDVLAMLRDMRAEGLTADTDYAGRSLKGQLAQAQKRANTIAIRTLDGWTLRRRRQPDVSGPSLKDLL
jgi:histidyl-tRNA synthetase